MGIINIALVDEEGRILKQVGQQFDTHYLDSLLPSAEDSRSQCLRFVDPYGDTVFNRLQMDQFLREWEELETRAASSDGKELLRSVRELAERCREGPHLYLRFYGD